MPFKSQAQRAFMHIHHPGMAKRWERETPRGKLPRHVDELSDFLEMIGVEVGGTSADAEPLPSVWDFFGGSDPAGE